jgi:diadenylate cyclase
MDALSSMRLVDILDICLVALIIYYIIWMVKGTRSGQAIVGLLLVCVTYYLSKRYQLLTLSFLIDYFVSNLFLVLVVLFGTDIRRGLARAGRFSFSKKHSSTLDAINEVIRAAFFMAEKRVGALIVFERRVGLGEYMESATHISAKVNDRLLLAIFNTQAPLHDGAVIIQDGRLEAANCFLPLLPSEDNVSKFFGTRHRAAIGLSRETDAIIVVVSEERGLVSLVNDGKVDVMMGAGGLRDRLLNLLGLATGSKKKKAPK